jgi:hypothetical protein
MAAAMAPEPHACQTAASDRHHTGEGLAMKTSWTVVAVAAAVAGTAIAAQADQIDLPARKPGLWQMKVTPKPAAAGKQITARLCLDAGSDKALMAQGLAITVSSCTMVWSRHNSDYVFDVACDIMGQKSKSHGVLSGDFQSHYVLDVDTENDGAEATAPDISGITQDSTWIGECEAGMQPGDMMLPGGRTINLLNVMRSGE